MTDVAVVGFGPVGCVLAVLLAQQGRSVVVLERWPEPYPLPRAVHLDHEAARILQSCGLGDDLAGISEPAEVYEWRNGEGTTLLRFGRVGDSLSGWPESSMFNQPALEDLLAGRAAALPGIEVRRGVEVGGLGERDDGSVAALGTDGTELATARVVIGCDGANSTVRGLVDAPVRDLGYFFDWLIVDVILDDRDRVFDPVNLQICNPARPTTVVSGGPGRRRWEFMRLPDEDRHRLDDEATAWELLAPWDVRPDNATLERHAVYTFQARWVERWRHGPVLLAGDAAHQMPPFAGQGLCAGLRDAANLAWKLDLVLAGLAPWTLLDTYGAERMPAVEAVIDFSIELGKVICVPDPDTAAERDAAMVAALTDGGAVARPAPTGRPFVQGRVDDGRRRGRFDDVVGVGWRLLLRAGVDVALDDELAGWFAAIGGRVVTIGPGGDVDDLDRTYADWFARHEVVGALQRPDFVLHGTATDGRSAVELVDSLRAAMRAGGTEAVSWPTDRRCRCP